METFDIILAIIIGLSAIISVLRGFTKECLSLIIWVLSFWIAIRFAPHLAPRFTAWVSNETVCYVLAFIALLLITLVLGMLLNHLIASWVQKSPLSSTDRLLGFLFGVLRGSVLVTITVFLLSLTPLRAAPWWQNSKVVPIVETLVAVINPADTLTPQTMKG